METVAASYGGGGDKRELQQQKKQAGGCGPSSNMLFDISRYSMT
jgi:hypothetical protein